MKKLLIGAMVLFMQLTTLGAPSHQVSTQSILIATPFIYRISLPILNRMEQAPSVGVFEIISSRNYQTKTKNIYDYQLQSFSIDQLVIPTQTIQFNPNQAPTILPSIPLTLISSLSPTHSSFNDIAPLYSLIHINWWLAGALIPIIVLIISLIFYANHRKKQRKPIIEAPPSIPAKIIAMNKLNTLKSELTDDSITIKAGYFQCTEILCQFIHNEFNIDAIDATTTEMNLQLKSVTQININQRKRLLDVSQHMDNEKFSNHPNLNLNELNHTIQVIQQLIQEIANDH